jgi:hypothetical protein
MSDTMSKAVNAMRPEWCKADRCRVLARVRKECKRTHRPMVEIMPMVWESDGDCLACADPSFNELLGILRAKKAHGRPKGTKRKSTLERERLERERLEREQAEAEAAESEGDEQNEDKA